MFLQDISTFEYFFAKDTNETVEFGFEYIQEFVDVDQIVGLANAEIVIVFHVIQKYGRAAFKNGTTKETTSFEAVIISFLFLNL